ncbi:MAM and LDL-receptor class A domain-containing protein 2 [Holothuria leucospilota]|uniref:MAM and LDL-receptor class A domain-containing protein 2 n=1 Tax=Holothuria leucospilota TaxID=206669 RepID=A0A9Q1BFN0_HOLLE|nr:MAM and LDL-receptor class A domain-containing protein 2 [Holothuria leucospilota]
MTDGVLVVKVYDGIQSSVNELLSPSCGSQVQWPSYPSTLLSTGTRMTVVFTSDDTFTAPGFRATFQQVPPREEFFLIVDASNSKIYKQNRLGTNAEDLMVAGLQRPVAVDFDPVERKVYFTDVVAKFIGRINIDGSDQETIATDMVDESKLYWVDARLNKIERSNFDGSQRQLLEDFDSNDVHPFSIVVLETAIFWTDWLTQGVDVTDRNFQNEATTLHVAGIRTRLHDMVYFSSGSLQLNCTFDYGTCGYSQMAEDDFDWSRRQGATPSSSTGPSVDHTTGTAGTAQSFEFIKIIFEGRRGTDYTGDIAIDDILIFPGSCLSRGYCMYIEATNRVVNSTARLISPSQNATDDQGLCLSFFYHMHGATINTLNVYLSSEGNEELIFSRSHNLGNTWWRAAVQLRSSSTWRIIFEGRRGTDYTGDIALDDILIFPGSCLSRELNCTFDYGTCGYYQMTEDDFDWTRHQGATPSSGTGPSGDHTTGTGYCMYIEATNREVNSTARLISSPQNATDDQGLCLSFFYHMHGATINTLNVYLSSEGNEGLIFTRSHNLGNTWWRAAVQLRSSSTWRELDSSNGYERKSHDERKVDNPLHKELDILSGIVPENMFRLGVRGEGGASSQNPRPLKVIFKQEWEKKEVIRKFAHASKTRKEALAGLSIGDDRTKWELAEFNQLKQELARRKENGEDDLVIRDLRIAKKRIIFEGRRELNCTFDYGTCGYSQMAEDDFDWTRHQGATPSSGTGPSGDHTTGTGYYMYIEATSRAVNSTARLISSPQGATNDQGLCLSFFYHMYGATINTLNVYLSSGGTEGLIFTRSHNLGNTWWRAAVPLRSSLTWRIIFEGRKGTDYTGDIAIDDVSIIPGPCLSRGYCMYIEATSREVNSTARLISSPQGATDDQGLCLSFFYHMYGATINTLNVYLSSGGNEGLIFTRSNNLGDNWWLAAVQLQSSSTWRIIFEGSRGTDYTGDIAIDDISIIPGSCPSRELNCTFDYGTCGYSQMAEDEFDWTRHQGATPSSGTGPSGDHTTGTGYCMYIEATSREVNSTARLISSPQGATDDQGLCLSFFYHMYGATINTLNVYLSSGGNEGLIFTRSHNLGDNWWRATVQLRSSSTWRIIFEGRRGTDYTGDIALDDISIFRGSCLSRELNCTFDYGTCGFSQMAEDDFDWTRHQGATPSSGTGPSGDHTTGTGYCMYIEATSREVNSTARLISSPQNATDDQGLCLSFFYHMYGATINTLNVYLSSGGNEGLIFTRSHNLGDNWWRAAVQLRSSSTWRIIFEGRRGTDYTGDIAIDDILIFPGSCLSRGYCMYIEATSREVNSTARLISSPQNATDDRGLCLSFFYHMYGATINTLNVYLSSGGTEGLIFTRSNNLDDNWWQAAVQLRSSSTWRLIFEGRRGTDYTGDIAIDDISVFPGSCPSREVNCTFDYGTCGYSQMAEDDFDWTRHQGATPSSSTGPSGDHTTGTEYYMYIEATNTGANSTARLISPPQDATDDQGLCLVFFYHMYGATINSLNVYLSSGGNEERIFTRSHNLGDSWWRATAQFRSSLTWRIIFEGRRGTDYTGDIAIDDISVFPGSC